MNRVQEESAHRRIDPLQDSFLLDPNDSDHASDIFLQPAKKQRMIYSCEECGTTYTEKRALARHRHTDLHRQRIGLPPIKKHPCSVCGKLFTRGHDRQRHENEKHRGVRRFPPLELGESGAPLDPLAQYAASSSTSQGTHSMSPESVVPLSMIDDAHWGTEMIDSLPFLKPPGVTSQPSRHSDAKGNHIGTGNSWWDPHDPAALAHEGLDVTSPKSLTRQPQPPAMRQYEDVLADHSHAVAVGREVEKPGSREDSVVDLDSRSESPASGLSSETGDSKRNYQGSCRDANWPMGSSSPRKASFQKSVTTGTSRSRDPTICIICSMPFEEDLDELLPHLKQHLETFQGEHRCADCQVDFVHKKDLMQHVQNAARGSCGFNFPHNRPCTGHHPPESRDASKNMADSDNFRLWNQLRNWEQSQLRAYVDEVNDLIATRKKQSTDWDSYSIEALLRSNRNSLMSFAAISVNTYASAPCDVAADGKVDIGGLQKRLRMMSLSNPRAQMRHLVSRRTGPVQRVGVLNKNLSKAVVAGDLHKVEELVDEGADKAIGSGTQAELSATALWGGAGSSRMLAAHSVQETLWGHCQTCNLNSEQLKKDIHIVAALLKHGADPNFVGGLCGSPLATAAWMGRSDLAFMLLRSGAHVDRAQGKYASTLCAAAAQAGHTRNYNVIKMLLEHGANLDCSNVEGTAAALLRRRRAYWELKGREKSLPPAAMDDVLASCDRSLQLLDQVRQDRAGRKRHTRGST